MIDKNKTHLQYPKDMDKQMIDICDAINFFPGVQTTFCCSGHGRQQFYICAKFTNIKSLKKIVKAFTTIDDDESISYMVQLSSKERKKYTYEEQYKFMYNIELSPLYEGYGKKTRTVVNLRISNYGLGYYMNNKRRKKELDRVIVRLYEYLDGFLSHKRKSII